MNDEMKERAAGPMPPRKMPPDDYDWISNVAAENERNAIVQWLRDLVVYEPEKVRNAEDMKIALNVAADMIEKGEHHKQGGGVG